MTQNQKLIFEYCREHGRISKSKATELIGSNYFINAPKYVGEVLSRMVKSGLLKRIKNGLFELGTHTKKEFIPENQLELFEKPKE